MKKYILIIILFLTTMQMSGQVLISLILGDKLNSGQIEFGLIGGGNWSKISGLSSHSFESNFNLGFYFDIKLKKPWYINTGVLVKSNLGTNKLTLSDLETIGAKSYEGDGTYHQQINAFQVPMLIRYRSKINLFAEAGIQTVWMYKSFVEYNWEPDDNETVINREYNKGATNPIDVGVMAGLGYKLKNKYDLGMTFSLRYYYGFVNVYKGISGTNNSSLYLEVTLPIGAKKAMAKRAKKEKEKNKK
jgi:hypothetical protein